MVTALVGLPMNQPEVRLPDLYVHLYPPALERDANGRPFLVFAAQVGNRGGGALEIDGDTGEPCHAGDGRLGVAAYQSLHVLGDWPPTAMPQARVGCLVYSPSHRHWHVADLLTYALVSEQGREVARQEKVGFCLADTAPGDVAKGLQRTAPRYRAPGAGTNCVDKTVSQGLSPGWSDVYGSATPGQSIDVSSVPDSTYRLVATLHLSGAYLAEGPGRIEGQVHFHLEGGMVRPLE